MVWFSRGGNKKSKTWRNCDYETTASSAGPQPARTQPPSQLTEKIDPYRPVKARPEGELYFRTEKVATDLALFPKSNNPYTTPSCLPKAPNRYERTLHRQGEGQYRAPEPTSAEAHGLTKTWVADARSAGRPTKPWEVPGSHPRAYRIGRLQVSPGSGPEPAGSYHYRSHAELQGHLDCAPMPTSETRPSKYPHRFNDNEQFFAPGPARYEYPSMAYGYGPAQNSRGEAILPTNQLQGAPNKLGPQFTRTVTDVNKQMNGVLWHPSGNRMGFERASEAWGQGQDYENMLHRSYPKNGNGVPVDYKYVNGRKVRL